MFVWIYLSLEAGAGEQRDLTCWESGCSRANQVGAGSCIDARTIRAWTSRKLIRDQTACGGAQ